MWQSRVEIIPLHNLTVLPHLKRCSTKLLLRAGLICAAEMHQYLISLPTTYEPCPYGSSTLQHFERSKAVEIHNAIMFNFYPGLPHIVFWGWVTVW